MSCAEVCLFILHLACFLWLQCGNLSGQCHHGSRRNSGLASLGLIPLSMVFRQIAVCGLSRPFLAAMVSFLTCHTDLCTGGLRVKALPDLLWGWLTVPPWCHTGWCPCPAVDRSPEVRRGRRLEGVCAGSAFASHWSSGGLTWRSAELQGWGHPGRKGEDSVSQVPAEGRPAFSRPP